MKNVQMFLSGILVFTLTLGFASLSEPEDLCAREKHAQLEEKWGVRPGPIRLTGAGHFIDFRYRVMDAEKAEKVVSRKHKAFLLDEDSGKVLPVPVTKIGPMRATARQAKQDREYFVLFSNANNEIKKGDKVTVIIGDFKVENLVVE